MALLAFAGAEDGIKEVDCQGVVNVSSDQARTGNYSFRPDTTTVAMTNAINMIISGVSTIYFQFALYCSSIESWFGDHCAFVQLKSGGTILMTLTYKTGGEIRLYLGDMSSLLATALANLSAGEWQLFEGKIIIADSGGVFQLKKNNISIIDFTGDTKVGSESTITNIFFGNMVNNYYSSYWYYDDIIIVDESGSYMNNWLGGLNIYRLPPIGAGNYSQWTPSTGNNWECVDETPPSLDGKVTSSTSGHKDSYILADLPESARQIKALVACYWGAGGNNIKRLLRINSTDYTGAALTLPGSLGKVQEIMYVSPASSAKWTPSEVNALESGMELV